MKTIHDFQTKYHQKLDSLDLELLIAAAIKKPREFVLAHPEYEISEPKIKNLELKIARRRRAEPLAYILGSKEFFGLEFRVGGATLIPRPETELLVEKAVEQAPQNTTIIDLGTGSGNIIIAIAKQLQKLEFRISNFEFFGIDISKKALVIARQNAKTHKVDKEINFLHGNLLEPLLAKNIFKIQNLPAGRQGSKFLILANLPYLDRDWKKLLKNKESAGLKFEPTSALYGGPDGLDLYRTLATQIKALQEKIPQTEITLFCEINHAQKKSLEKIFSFAKNSEAFKDLAKKWRIVKFTI